MTALDEMRAECFREPGRYKKPNQRGAPMKAPGGCARDMVLMAMLLLAGCQSADSPRTGRSFQIQGPSYPATVSLSDSISQTLAKTGFASTDLVLMVTLALPKPTRDTDSNTVWRGVFSGSEQALLQLDDRILVIACSRDASHFSFSAPLRNWGLFPDNRERNWQQVWFNGTLGEFLRTIRADRRFGAPILASVNAPDPPIRFPLQVTPDAMRSDLVQLGLAAMADQFKTERDAGRVCTPELSVYMQLASRETASSGVGAPR